MSPAWMLGCEMSRYRLVGHDDRAPLTTARTWELLCSCLGCCKSASNLAEEKRTNGDGSDIACTEAQAKRPVANKGRMMACGVLVCFVVAVEELQGNARLRFDV